MSEVQPTAAPTRRLFFAVYPDEHSRAAIADTVERLQKAAHFTPLKAAWVPADQYHVTLFFMGNVPEAAAQGLKRALESQPSGIPGFRLDVRRLGFFPTAGKEPPKVLWIGVHKPQPELIALRQFAAILLAKNRIPVPDQDFSPHITLARFKSTKGIHPFRQIIRPYEYFKAGKSIVTRLCLVESETGGGPARYKPFAYGNLDPAPPELMRTGDEE